MLEHNSQPNEHDSVGNLNQENLHNSTPQRSQLKPQEILQTIIEEVISNPSLRSKVEKSINCRQQEGLLLRDLTTGVDSTIDISLLPIYISKDREEALKQVVSDLSLSKSAIVESAVHNKDLRHYLLDGLEDISKEIHSANLEKLPSHLRLRYDTFTDLSGEYIRQIELNGGEPQGDIIMTKVVEVARDIIEMYFEKRGISQDLIQECFADLQPPVHQCAEASFTAYKALRQHAPSLPEQGNVGIFAFKDPESRAPLSSLSNAEAVQSEEYYTAAGLFKHSLAFDPFDITSFEEHTTRQGKKFVLPVISIEDQNAATVQVPIHFIRRLHGEPMENIPVWQELKDKKPEVYYKLIGLQDNTYNPEGLSVPTEAWMNPLNSLMTDKKLDAILTDERLIQRFKVNLAVQEKLIQQGLVSSPGEARKHAADILNRAKVSISDTRSLRSFDTGLYEGDRDKQGTLSDSEVMEIKSNRAKYVVKLGTLTGHSGTGVFVGGSLDLSEIPTQALSYTGQADAEFLNKLAGQSDKGLQLPAREQESKALLQSLASLQDQQSANIAADILWNALIDYSMEHEQAIIQERAKSQKGPVIVASTNGPTLSISEKREYNLDLNPQAFYDRLSYVLIRGSSSAKANITGGYGCLVPCFRSTVAEKIISLFRVAEDLH